MIRYTIVISYLRTETMTQIKLMKCNTDETNRTQDDKKGNNKC